MEMDNFGHDLIFVFTSLLAQGLPFLALGSIIGALATALIPIEQLLQKLPRSRLASAALGGLSACVLPSCECIVIPLIRRLVASGLPSSTAIAYLLAAPVLNPLCILSTYSAFSASKPLTITLLRLGGSFILAVSIAYWFSRSSKSELWSGDLVMSINPRPTRTRWPGWRAVVGSAIGDFWSVTGFYIFGALCASALQLVPATASLAADPSASAQSTTIFYLMALAILMSVCSSVDAFVANSFIGYALGAKMAFMWLGPVLDLKLILIYQSLFKRKKIIWLSIVLIVSVALMAHVVNLFWGDEFL